MPTSTVIIVLMALSTVVVSGLRLGLTRGYCYGGMAQRAFNMDGDVGSEDLDFENRNSRPLNVDDKNMELLTTGISNIVSRAAINTVSYYMLEFNDEVNEKWMMHFADYNKIGFVNGVWTDYIEEMIKTNKIEFPVLIKAPKNLRRGKSAPEGNNVMFQYTHELEPRKVANRLITVRQDISEELLNDLGSVLYEHKEVSRYVRDLMARGKEEAEKGRKMTMAGYSMSSGTPLRYRNYADCSHLITEITVAVMKHNLEAERDEESVSYLEEILLAQQDIYAKKDPSEKLLSYAFTPRALMEDLYMNGLQKGIVARGKKSINTMSLAQAFLSTRESLAKEVVNIVRAENAHNRRYYKMITDCGGFKKLDLSPAPKFSIFDLDEYIRNQGSADVKELLANPVVLLPTKGEVMEQIEKAADAIIAAKPSAATDEEQTASVVKEEDLFGSAVESFSGPMLM